ncbi:MAG TPA: VWA domain-containing protein [Jiangellaceae bacterium]|nr:VWA domain-containing protein [Jiangellaceae bacterium]
MTAVAAMVGFARTLRAAGIAAGPERVHAWADALRHLDAGQTAHVYWSGRLTLCSGPDDLLIYDAAFAAYFGEQPVPTLRRRPPSATVIVPVPSEEGTDGRQESEGTSLTVSASRQEVLRHRDIARLTAAERAEVGRLLAALSPIGPTRRSRRRRPSRHGRLDPARTVRAMLRRGGEPARLHHRERVERPRRLVLLIDVSGSMSAYADSLLRFAHAACRRRPSTEVFTIGTRLTRVSRELRQPDPDRALAAASAAVPDWSGGTRLGEQLKAFLDRWGQRGTARGAVIVVASDGWERGDVSLLGAQMVRLRRLAHRVVWVSPHAGKDGFAPATAGLQAALPSVDRLVAGNTADALDRLARLVSRDVIPGHVDRGPRP